MKLFDSAFATLFKKLFFLPISLSEIAEMSLHFKNYF